MIAETVPETPEMSAIPEIPEEVAVQAEVIDVPLEPAERPSSVLVAEERALAEERSLIDAVMMPG